MDKIAALRALFQASEREVKRLEFTTFSEALLRQQTAILAVSWLPRVTEHERARRTSCHDRVVSPATTSTPQTRTSLAPVADLTEYFPVLYSSREIPGSRY